MSSNKLTFSLPGGDLTETVSYDIKVWGDVKRIIKFDVLMLDNVADEINDNYLDAGYYLTVLTEMTSPGVTLHRGVYQIQAVVKRKTATVILKLLYKAVELQAYLNADEAVTPNSDGTDIAEPAIGEAQVAIWRGNNISTSEFEEV